MTHSVLTALLRGFLVSLIPALLAYVAKRRRFQAERSGQWRSLSAGPTERFLVTLCFLAALGFGYLIFLSYPRSSGDMVAVIALVVMFLAPAVVMYLFAFKVHTRWNDTYVEQQRLLRRKTVIRFKDIVAYGITPISSCFWFGTSDRTIIYVSSDAHGTGELIKQIAGEKPPMVLRPATVGLA